MKEQVVKEWLERGKHDLEVAKILLAEEEYFDVVLKFGFAELLLHRESYAPFRQRRFL